MSAPAGRTAAVTGASRGIGRSTALALARLGYRVFALARSESDLQCLAADAGREGLEIRPIVMDVADEGSREQAVRVIEEATEGYGVDVLVNNAGYGQLGPVEEVPPDLVRRQMEVNLIGPLALTQAFLPAMRRRRAGVVVNVSSIAGRISTPFMGPYSASKFALEALSDALRLELTPFGVHVVLIEPGPIHTNFGRAARATSVERPGSPYAPYLRSYRLARRGSDLFTGSSERVAGVIVRAVESRHPRPRYTVTLPAKLGTAARRLVPDVVMDGLFRLGTGLWRRA